MNNKTRKIIALASVAAMFASFAAIANAQSENKIYVNGNVLKNAEVKKVDDTSFLPLRAICEDLGFEVNWINESRTIELVKMPIYITCSPDRDGYTFARTAPMLLGSAPVLIDDTTYVPVNFIDEILKGTYETQNGSYHISYGEEVAPATTTISGTVCDLIFEEDKLTQLVIGNAEDVMSQTALNLSEELAELCEELNIVIGTEITCEVKEMATMSIPPQMIPVSIAVVEATEVPSVSGTVCELIYEDEKLVKIVIGDIEDPMTQTVLNVTEELAAKALEAGVKVGSDIYAEVQEMATMSIPPQMFPVSIEIVETSEAIEDKIIELVYEDEKLVQIVIGDETNPLAQTVLNLSEELAAKALELKAEKGKTIVATASLMKTRSIPAQQALISIEEIR